MPATRKSHCVEDLRMRILRQDIAPGSDIDEAALCAQYTLSRTPMREIFQRLAGEGYLQLSENRGPKVASLDLPTLRMFFQTAPMVYANVARLAAEHRRSAEIDQLRTIQTAFRTACKEQNTYEASLQNHRFHHQIGVMAHNPYLMPSLNRMLIDHTRLSQTFYRPANEEDAALVETAADHHDLMIDAIETHEMDRIVALTIEHWTLSKDRLEKYVSPDPLPIMPLMKDQTHAI